jgi:flagellar biogenesis protein FliO
MQTASRLALLLVLLPTVIQGAERKDPVPVKAQPTLSAAPSKAATPGAKSTPVSKAAYNSADSETPIKLSPPPANLTGKSASSSGMKAGKLPAMNDLGGAAMTMFSGLGIVLGLFLTTIWLVKKRGGGRLSRWLPKEAFEVLGRAPLTGRQSAHLIRCGNKIIVLAISPTGIDPITEITDPLEVDRLAGICYQAQSGSASANFSQTLSGLTRKTAAEPIPSASGSSLRKQLGDYDV